MGAFDIFKPGDGDSDAPEKKKSKGMFAMLDAFSAENIAEMQKMLTQLPGALAKWDTFLSTVSQNQKILYEKIVELQGDISMVKNDTARIIAILEPGGITPEIHEERAAEAALDPRNQTEE